MVEYAQDKHTGQLPDSGPDRSGVSMSVGLQGAGLQGNVATPTNAHTPHEQYGH